MAEREWTQDEIDEDMFRYDDENDCACEQVDVDLLEGRAHCYVCGRFWYLTGDELRAELRCEAEYQECLAEEMDGADSAGLKEQGDDDTV